MNIYDLISRAQKLRKETQLDSVSPDRVGGLHEDTLKYINEFQLLASSPSLHKIYASVSAMQSDGAPKSDLTGKPLKPGQLVVIVPANQTDATAGDVYRYDGPSGNTSAWTFVAKIGAVPADAELSATSTNPPQNKVVTEKFTELESNLGLEISNSFFAIGEHHSSVNDGIALSVKRGNTITILAESDADVADMLSVFAYYSDGTDSRLGTAYLNQEISFVAPSDIIKVGLYFVIKNEGEVKFTAKGGFMSETENRLSALEEKAESKITSLFSQVGMLYAKVPVTGFNVLDAKIQKNNTYIVESNDTARRYYAYYGTTIESDYIEILPNIELVAEQDIMSIYVGKSSLLPEPTEEMRVKVIGSIEDRLGEIKAELEQTNKIANICPYKDTLIDFTAVGTDKLILSIPKDTLIRTTTDYWYATEDLSFELTWSTASGYYLVIAYDSQNHTFKALRWNETIPDGMFFLCYWTRGWGTSLPMTFYTVNGVNSLQAIKDSISSLELAIIPNTDILSLNPKDSVGQRVIQAHRKTNLSRISDDIKPNFVMSVITDLHADHENLERFFRFNHEYQSYITEQIQMGDIVNDKFDDDYSFYTSNPNTKDVLCVIGNHDTRVYNNGAFDDYAISGVDTYAKFFKPYEADWIAKCIFPANAGQLGKCYYYKDYSISHNYNAVNSNYAKYKSEGIRVIVTDTSHIDSTQIAWLDSVLNDAIDKKLSVLIVRHYPMGAINKLGNFNTIDFKEYSKPSADINRQMYQSVDTFIDNGGEFICWMTGDTHYDLMGTLKDSNNKQIIMSFENGGASSSWNDSERIKGQKSQDSFNIVVIDTYSKLLKVVRIGNDCDRYLRSKKGVVLQYDTQEIISEL